MCKPKKPKTVEVKDPVYVRNSYLDSAASPLNSQRSGRNSLRIGLGGNGLSIPARGAGTAGMPGETPEGVAADKAHVTGVVRRIARAF